MSYIRLTTSGIPISHQIRRILVKFTIKVYKLDKVAALRHIAAAANVSLSYRSRSRMEEAQRKQRQRQKAISPDKSAQYGPQNRS